jgi:5-methylcytosine-specific restriction endonuclease McrA
VRREPNWKRPLMQALAQEEGRWCHYCRDDLNWPWEQEVFDHTTASIDHVVPRSKGGTDDFDNLVLACPSCNSSKGTRDYDEFCRKIDGREPVAA